uniref:Bifunctional inhibitor/plant lipid transfer protein/seed storage helical domain-containing protein n=1 Tax=Leersia perrieri TaxID=77586 RepID=A0A0D9XXY2_9ORYZ
MVSAKAKVVGGVLFFLILLVCSVAVPHPTSAEDAPPPSGRHCTEAQKEEILHKCIYWVKIKPPSILPLWTSPCCEAVSKVQNLDMQCIIDLLTSNDKERVEGWKIRMLHGLCK